MSGCVTVTGPPRAIWRRKSGMTLPDEPSTLPKRTEMKLVPLPSRAAAVSTIHSQSAFVWPRTFFGRTALSVETSTNCLTPCSAASSASTFVPSTLLRTDSSGFASISGTCL